MLREIVESCFERAKELQSATGRISLERGFAMIPLPGIDVPFHSRYLWAGVMPFRACELIPLPASSLKLIPILDLSKKIKATHLNPDMLIGRYIPNLIAWPFEVSRTYAQQIYDRTSSLRLDKVLKRWDEDGWAKADTDPIQQPTLAYVILVELLAYQFASPVRWIETQDPLFTNFAFERFIEIGPSPMLTGSTGLSRPILCHAKHGKEIYYQFEDDIEAPPANGQTSLVPSAPPAATIPVTSAPAAPPSVIAASVEDVPIKAMEILGVVVAQKLKKRSHHSRN
jgi:fatty acid synthase subunit alpha